uniref:Venom peptide ECTX1-Rm31b n=1 Tax=Rhytidoponera metallica TaxID=148364 RepID=A0A8U0LU17_RHYMT|nr:venom peptide precursor ECTX1-Rm31b [Rhytidoponera metallica]
MKLSWLSWALAIIFVMAIMDAPTAEAKALASPEAKADADASADASADAFAEAEAEAEAIKWKKIMLRLGKWGMKTGMKHLMNRNTDKKE